MHFYSCNNPFCPILDNVAKTHHLRTLHGAKERLELLRADLLEEGSFDAPISGCEGVFHTATPVKLVEKDPKVRFEVHSS